MTNQILVGVGQTVIVVILHRAQLEIPLAPVGFAPRKVCGASARPRQPGPVRPAQRGQRQFTQVRGAEYVVAGVGRRRQDRERNPWIGGLGNADVRGSGRTIVHRETVEAVATIRAATTATATGRWRVVQEHHAAPTAQTLQQFRIVHPINTIERPDWKKSPTRVKRERRRWKTREPVKRAEGRWVGH